MKSGNYPVGNMYGFEARHEKFITAIEKQIKNGDGDRIKDEVYEAILYAWDSGSWELNDPALIEDYGDLDTAMDRLAWCDLTGKLHSLDYIYGDHPLAEVIVYILNR